MKKNDKSYIFMRNFKIQKTFQLIILEFEIINIFSELKCVFKSENFVNYVWVNSMNLIRKETFQSEDFFGKDLS